MGKSLSYKLFLVVILFVVSNSNAQWVKTNRPDTSYSVQLSVYQLCNINEYIFARTSNGIYSSSNSGADWAQVTYPVKDASLNLIATG